MKPKPTQLDMFAASAQDLPLFSGTAQHVTPETFTPHLVEIQDPLPLSDTRPYWEVEKGWDTAGNCTHCGEAGRCHCQHPRIDNPPAPTLTLFQDVD